MEKIRIPRIKIVRSRWGIYNPLLKLFLLLIISLSVTSVKDFFHLFLYLLMLLSFIFIYGLKFSELVNKIRYIYFLIFIILSYFIVLLLKTENIRYAILETFHKMSVLLIIFGYSFIFVITTKKLDLARVSSLLLYPFRLFIPPSTIFIIQYQTIKLVPLIFASVSEEMKLHFSLYKNRLKGFLMVFEPIANVFYNILNGKTPCNTISTERSILLYRIKRPTVYELFISIFISGVSFAIIYL